MFDDLAALFFNDLAPKYQAYEVARDARHAGRNDHLRAALQVIISLFHFREHLPPSHAMTRADVERVCPEYRLMGDIANAAKHRGLTKGTPMISSITDVVESTVVVRHTDGDGEYSDVATAIYARCRDGVERYVDREVAIVANFWGLKVGAVTGAPFSPWAMPVEPGSVAVPRSAAQQVSLEALQGLKFLQQFRLLTFDKALNRAVPIDLSAKEIAFRLFKPIQLTVQLIATSPEGHEEVFDIELDDAQHRQLSARPTDVERTDFLTEQLRQGRLTARRVKSEQA